MKDAHDGYSVMIRAVAFLTLPLLLIGAGAAVLRDHRAPASGTPVMSIDDGGVIEPTVVGMNPSSLSYFSGEWAFNDLVQNAASIRVTSYRWPEADTVVPFDNTGHPIHVPKGTNLAVILQSGSLQVRAGTYACAITEGWSVQPLNGGWKMKGAGKRFVMIVDRPTVTGGLTLMLTALRDDASLNTLSCVPQDKSGLTVFNPTFLDEIAPYKVLRFMDWMRTNGAPQRVWADRTTPAFLSQGTQRGVALEHMVALANAMGADPWFNMPFDADAGYYENFAVYVRDHLDPKLKAYVEFSNEVWNEAFPQGKSATQRGRAIYPGADPTTANDFYYADRVRDVMGVWKKVFSGQERRLVRVLADQAVWADRADRALAHNDTWKTVDALAIAPYFSTNVYDLPGSGSARVDALFAKAPEIVSKAISNAIAAKKIARKFNLRLVAYEAGPSFVGYQKEIGADMLAASRDPRIYDMYMAYLKRWQHEVGGLIVLFDQASTPGPGGQFGHREYTGQPLSDAPKARAVNDFMAQLPH